MAYFSITLLSSEPDYCESHIPDPATVSDLKFRVPQINLISKGTQLVQKGKALLLEDPGLAAGPFARLNSIDLVGDARAPLFAMDHCSQLGPKML